MKSTEAGVYDDVLGALEPAWTMARITNWLPEKSGAGTEGQWRIFWALVRLLIAASAELCNRRDERQRNLAALGKALNELTRDDLLALPDQLRPCIVSLRDSLSAYRPAPPTAPPGTGA